MAHQTVAVEIPKPSSTEKGVVLRITFESVRGIQKHNFQYFYDQWHRRPIENNEELVTRIGEQNVQGLSACQQEAWRHLPMLNRMHPQSYGEKQDHARLGYRNSPILRLSKM